MRTTVSHEPKDGLLFQPTPTRLQAERTFAVPRGVEQGSKPISHGLNFSVTDEEMHTHCRTSLVAETPSFRQIRQKNASGILYEMDSYQNQINHVGIFKSEGKFFAEF